ncbi:MAG TPA: Rid family detoxifying hydrolase [Pyrinomonadaceae bacterium]|nr:Rid family detoxifying hydrolase [Pyrinomonadaceae bacterium]
MEHYSFSDTTIPPAYGPYSHAIVAGDFVFLAGQIGRDSVSGRLIDGDITTQTTRCLEIVSDILEKLGLSLSDVVRTTVFLSDIGDFDAMNRVYSATFKAPYPVRSTPQVKMPFGALVGIEVTAYRGRQAKRRKSSKSRHPARG